MMGSGSEDIRLTGQFEIASSDRRLWNCFNSFSQDAGAETPAEAG